MAIILANDGISAEGAKILTDTGHQLITDKVEQDDLISFINEKKVDCLLVRSATKIRANIIDSCKSLKLLGRGGVGMDNIDVAYAKEQGLEVYNTPTASSHSVAELVIAHLFTGLRFLHDSNRNLPAGGDFKKLKKQYGKGREVAGKTMGIIGFGNIGQQVAKICLGLGMKVVAMDIEDREVPIALDIAGSPGCTSTIRTCDLDCVLSTSDFVTIHTPLPADKKPLITKEKIALMKDGAVILNVARGGVIDEDALIEALKSGKLSFAGVDVFVNEPTPREDLLKLDNVSVTPHIGGATVEAQARIGIEIAERINTFFKG